jgi:hypothetical protein
VSKRVIRIPPLKTGKRVRLTFEVSADVDRKKSARTTSARKKAKQSQPTRQRSNAARPDEKARMSTQPSTTPETKAAADVPAPPKTDFAPALAAGGKAAPQQPVVVRRMTRSHAAALAAVGILVVAALALPRRSALVDTPATDSKPEAHDSPAQPIEAVPDAPAPKVESPAAAVAQPEVASPVVVESVKKSPAKPTQKLAATRPPVVMPVVETRDKETSKREDIMAATVPVPTPAPPVPETAAVDQVTITGCLEASGNGDRFRLTDTEGASAPKARSWRTGFLKKHSAAVDLVGAADVAALQRQVGKRVAVSGVQTDRALKVSSVRVVSPSCN